jgi:hypothetical protein
LGIKTGRIHQCFSDLEYKAFLVYDILKPIIDIREQFPLLPLEETLEIADRLKLRHPRDRMTKYPVVMTTDFLLKLKLENQTLFHARTAKYERDLKLQRVRDYFKIEHFYWLRREVDWGYVTERDIHKVVADNAALIHPFHLVSDLHPLNEQEISAVRRYMGRRLRQDGLALGTVVGESDQMFGLTAGKSFAVVCHLLARGLWRVDFHKPITLKEPLVLL